MSRGKYQRPPVINFAMGTALILFWLVVITTYLSAGLFAKYTTRGSGADDARVAQFGQLILAENGVNGSIGQEFLFIPGTELDKDVTVSFGGSESDTFVFVELDTTGWERDGDYDYYLGAATNPLLSWSVDPSWSYLTSDEEKNQHIYYKVLDSNEKLEAEQVITDGKIQVAVATKATYEDLQGTQLRLYVTAHVVQANGFYISDDMKANALAGWNSLNKK